MRFKQDREELATLRGDEVKLLLALALDAQDRDAFVSSHLYQVAGDLAFALYGDNAPLIDAADVQQLVKEAYVEYRGWQG